MWTGWMENGYGAICFWSRDEDGELRKRRIPAHKVFWQEKNGPVPAGYDLHHKCRRPLCVNPDHLEPLTASDHQELHGRRKLTADLVLQLRTDRSDGMTFPALGKKYGIRGDHAQAIVYGECWKNVGMVA